MPRRTNQILPKSCSSFMRSRFGFGLVLVLDMGVDLVFGFVIVLLGLVVWFLGVGGVFWKGSVVGWSCAVVDGSSVVVFIWFFSSLMSCL